MLNRGICSLNEYQRKIMMLSQHEVRLEEPQGDHEVLALLGLTTSDNSQNPTSSLEFDRVSSRAGKVKIRSSLEVMSTNDDIHTLIKRLNQEKQ